MGVEEELEVFLRTAHEEDLLVLLRPGPFIDAERDLGGMPAWLLAIEPKVRLRTGDEAFLKPVDRWFSYLYGRLSKFMRHNGGPIIAVQV